MIKILDNIRNFFEPLRKLLNPLGCDEKLMESLKEARNTFGYYEYNGVKYKMTKKQIDLYDDYWILDHFTTSISVVVGAIICSTKLTIIKVLVLAIAIMPLCYINGIILKKIIDLEKNSKAV